MNRPLCGGLLLLTFSLGLLSCGGGGTTGSGGTGGGGGGNSQPQQIACTSPAAPGTLCYSLSVNNVTRTYALHVPANFQKNSSALIIALHGSGGNGLNMESTTGFSPLADQDGFAVAYPDGLVEASEGVTDWAYFFNDFTDDVTFIRQLIGALQTTVTPDPKKIFVSGFSAGAFMAHRLGVQASDLVAGIGVAEGAISSGSGQTIPSPLGPVSVVILHGDQDHTVSYCGSPTDASQEATFNYWTGSSANSCATFDTQAALCSTQGTITTVVEKNASSCKGSTEVTIYRLLGGTHTWNTGPMNVSSQTPYNPALDSTTGVTTRDILWDFFSTHPKP